MEDYHFDHTAVAGTFDRLHEGHKALLTKAFQVAKNVSVGITARQMIQTKELASLVEPFTMREQSVLQFLREKRLTERATIFPLHDIYGPAVTDPTIEALVVSTKTVEGADEVNKERGYRSLPPLVIVVCDYVASQDNSYLSSTRIRLGEIDRTGFSYLKFLQGIAPYVLSVQTRMTLGNPLGRVISGSEENLDLAIEKAKPFAQKATVACAVGDVVSFGFTQAKIGLDLSIFDFKNKRKPMVVMKQNKTDINLTLVKNQPGQIDLASIKRLASIIKKITRTEKHGATALNKHRANIDLLVDGEEDLLVLPLILLLPLASTIFYGQSGQGIVTVEITEQKKQEIVRLMQ